MSDYIVSPIHKMLENHFSKLLPDEGSIPVSLFSDGIKDLRRDSEKQFPGLDQMMGERERRIR